MDAFALPLVAFTAMLGWLLVELFRGSFSDPVPRRAGVTFAVTCPAAGLLFGIGLAPLAIILGVVSMTALGSLAAWFLSTDPDDSDDPPAEPVDPDPSPSDDIGPEPEFVVEREITCDPDPEPVLDWDEFDRDREEWEKESPAPAPERSPAGV